MLSTVLSALTLVHLSIAGYVVHDTYDPSNFFDQFSFFDQTDPTQGFVDYVSADVANSSGLIDTSGGSVYIGTDHTNEAPNGRPSVRITSNKSYNEGLVILDLEHFPGGICGTWPAFWMVGPNWPSAGEIDIMEGANTQSTNSMTLHTSSGCEIGSSSGFAGTMSTDNCFVNAAGQDENAGCGISDTDEFTYSGFNENKGGVFATEIDPDNNAISIWFFSRSSIPSDITSGNPDPTSWGQPRASFNSGCDIAEHFQDLQIVFDLTFCGSWAGSAWSSDSTCAAMSDSCDAYVESNPSAFTDAYWTINSLKVYQ
ncbi:glycoside hydrolase family 16 protein, partial [Saccharata proteae CBS 121410]